MIVNLESLSSLRVAHGNQRIVLATGTFDLFHYEHLRYLQKAKTFGDILVVGVKDNKCARLKNENRPIIDQDQRIAIVDALECVDYTVIVSYEENFETLLEFDNEQQKQWLSMFEKVFEYLRPDVLYHEENPVLQSARERVSNHYGLECISKKREVAVSTTEIIKKISKSIN